MLFGYLWQHWKKRWPFELQPISKFKYIWPTKKHGEAKQGVTILLNNLLIFCVIDFITSHDQATFSTGLVICLTAFGNDKT